MKNRLPIIFLIFILALQAPAKLKAQDDYYVDISTSNSNPSVNEQFRVDYILKFKGSSGSFNLSGIRIKAPSFEGFKIIDQGGSMDMNMNFGFGRRDADMSLYRYSYILEAQKEGQFTIEPFTYIWQNKSFKSGELNISVSKAGKVKKPSATGEDKDGLKPDDLFARTIVSKNSIYKGEPLLVTYKLFSKKNITGLEADELPDYDGFWTEDIDIGELKVRQERLQGEVYNVVTIDKKLLFPQKSGKLEIGGFNLKTTVSIIKTRKPRSRFEQQMYGNRIRYRDNVSRTVASPSVDITVKEFPDNGKPADFNAMAGSYQMTAELTRDSLALNEATNLKVTISGSGNIKLLDPPDVNFPPDFEVYDPEVKVNTDINSGGMSGSKTFDYVLIPRSQGEFSIPPISFSYFDVLKEKYVTLTSGEFKVLVGKGKGEGQSAIQSYAKEEVQRLGTDIMYIYKAPIALHPKNNYLVNTWYFWVLLLIFPFMLLTFYLIRRKKQIIMADDNLMKNRRATRLARKRLKKAKSLKDEGRNNEFYEEINRAYLGYLSDRFNIPFSEISRENIAEKLQHSHISEEHISRSTTLLDDCDYARFAPGASGQNMDAIYERAVKLISNIEKDLK